MKPGVRARLHDLASDRPLQLLTAIAVAIATAAAASPLAPMGAARVGLASVVERAVSSVPPEASSAPAPLKLVWEGADVDGDGKADFANPTGHEPRGHDAYGEGEFGASRDGGVRRHDGVDFKAEAGQPVAAPISGYVSKIGFAYPGDQTLKFVEITNPALHYAARVFYVNPGVQVGETVAVGDPIGSAHSLQRKYPGGMTNHVHLEILKRSGARIDAARMITAEYVRPDAPATMAAAD